MECRLCLWARAGKKFPFCGGGGDRLEYYPYDSITQGPDRVIYEQINYLTQKPRVTSLWRIFNIQYFATSKYLYGLKLVCPKKII